MAYSKDQEPGAMRSTISFVAVIVAFATALGSQGAEPERPKYYLAEWESLRHYEVPEWYQDAKIGVWPIWGPYSVSEYRGNHAAEWYPRWMYLIERADKPFSEYELLGAASAKHHRDAYGDPSDFGYHDFIPMFKGEKWDPDEWAQFGVDCGAKFFTVLSEFHDGFAMYDSSYTKWDSVDMGPKRDVTLEIKRAVHEKGLRFGVSNHFAHNRNFYSYYFNNGFSEEQAERPELAELYSNGVMDRAYINRWWRRTTELAEKYDPDLYYFDWGWNGDYWAKERPEFCAFFYNQAIRNGKGEFGKPGVVINYKNTSIARGCAVLDLERGKMSEPQSFVWQTDTSVSDYSWGYSKTDQYKSAKHLITLLSDIVSKNGVLMLAFGPKADGTIPEEYAEPMLAMGEWLKANGEAIYATRPWGVAQEGPNDSNNEEAGDLFEARDIRYTRSKDGSALYAISFGLPHTKLTLLSTEVVGGQREGVITMLANEEKIPFEVNDKKQLVLDLSGVTPENAGCEHAYAYRIEGLELNPVRLGVLGLSDAYLRESVDYEPFPGGHDSEYPYLSGAESLYEVAHNGVKRDTNYHGKGIKIGGKSFERGLMVCPAGRQGLGVFVVGLKKTPRVNGLSAWVGIEDAAASMGSSEFIVEARVDGEWERIFKSDVLTTDDEAVEVDVRFPEGAEFVRLITTDGRNGPSADHAIWADVRFTD